MAAILAGQYGPEGLEFPDGRPARNTAVEIRRLNGTLAELFADKNKSALVPNPTRTDQYGNIRFLAVPGEYRMLVNGTPIPILVPLHPDDPGFGVGGEGTGGYVHEQTTGALLVQVQHNLPWYPGGVTSIETDGDQIEHSQLSHPAPGLLELLFLVPFTGKVYVS